MINRYGAADLCGAMSGIMDAFVIAATHGYQTLQDAISGFMDGYEAHHEEGKKAELVYLSDGEEGFAMPDSAYHLMSRRMENFSVYNEMVFPLLGGSGLGVLRCMNDEESNKVGHRKNDCPPTHVGEQPQHKHKIKHDNMRPRDDSLRMQFRDDIVYLRQYSRRINRWGLLRVVPGA